MSWADLCARAGIDFDPYEPSVDLLRRLAAVPVEIGPVRFGPTLYDLHWRDILLDESEVATRGWATRACGLEQLGIFDGVGLFVDRYEDASGAHRIYSVSTGVPSLVARDVDDLLDALVEERNPHPGNLDDPFSQHPRSIERVLPLLQFLDPGALFGAHRRRSWPGLKKRPQFAGFGPGWPRGVIVFVLATFRRSRKLALPESIDAEVDADALLPVHHELFRYLEDLEAAIAIDDVPESVAILALDDDEEISRKAQKWMDLFDKARGAVGGTTTHIPTKPAGPSNVDVRQALMRAVDELVMKEMLELEKGGRKPLEDELTASFFKSIAMMEAGSTLSRRGAMKALIDVMIDSEHVVDVFADDHALLHAFRQALGG